MGDGGAGGGGGEGWLPGLLVLLSVCACACVWRRPEGRARRVGVDKWGGRGAASFFFFFFPALARSHRFHTARLPALADARAPPRGRRHRRDAAAPDPSAPTPHPHSPGALDRCGRHRPADGGGEEEEGERAKKTRSLACSTPRPRRVSLRQRAGQEGGAGGPRRTRAHPPSPHTHADRGLCTALGCGLPPSFLLTSPQHPSTLSSLVPLFFKGL